jgi:pimeloyl-ACP methyl ester carboxylesterase
VPAAFVHSVPETTHVWHKVRAELDAVETVALELPGFGVAAPDGFGATMDEYADWLIGEVAAIDGPVDLVGHDWGALLVARLVSTRPELVRSWSADCIGGFDPIAWRWHQVAQIWQTPGEGEQLMDTILGMPPEDQVPTYTAMGVPEADALAMIRGIDRTMTDSILKLYRSAVGIERIWGAELGEVPAPGLVMVLPADPLNVESAVRHAAERASAEVAVLEGVGHFWPYEAPALGAAMLRDFWESL